MFTALKKFFVKSWQEGTQIGRANILTAVYLGGGAHLSLYFVYKYFFGLYENLFLRLITLFLCVSVGYFQKLPIKIREYLFPFYWHLMLIMALPFTLSVNLFKNNFHEAWLYWEIAMIFILAIYVPNWFIFILDLLAGVGGAFLFYLLTTPIVNLNPDFNIYAYLIVFLFSGVAGLGFVYGNKAAWLNKQKQQYSRFLALTGSIVHEIRNPLNAISLNTESAKTIIGSRESVALNADQNQRNKELKLLEINNNLSKSVVQANEIINIILSDLKDKTIQSEEFRYVDVQKILTKIIDGFGYRNSLEKAKTSLKISTSFIFRAVPDRFDFIIYNLLKNALYYLSQFSDSNVVLGTENRFINQADVVANGELQKFLGQEVNVVYVYDNGPGISDEVKKKLFNDFFTHGKAGGTGLGLAFCRRNVRLFGGEIICESQAGKDDGRGEKTSGWTKFSIILPKLSDEELQLAKAKLAETNKNLTENSQAKNGVLSNSSVIADLSDKSARILVVDDQQVNLMVTKAKLMKYLPFLVCDTALGGKEAIRLFQSNKYDLILMDIQMPELDGIQTATEIKKIHAKKVKSQKLDYSENRLPIIALTSLDFETFSQEAGKNKASFEGYLNKGSEDRLICRMICKWLVINDQFAYLEKSTKTRPDWQENLANYQIILADDQEMNLKLIARLLEDNGMKVATAINGNRLIELYKSSIISSSVNADEHKKFSKKSDFDLILTDINMPGLTGVEAAQEIRKFELENKVNYQQRIPIIALSGDGEKKDIYRFFDSKIDDYFIKGRDPANLIRLLTIYIQKGQNIFNEEDQSNLNHNHLKQESVRIEENLRSEQIHYQNKNQNQPSYHVNDQSELKIFDPKKIQFLGSDDQKEMIELFLKNSTEIINKIKACKQENKLSELSFAIHSLKGICGNIGGEKLNNFIKIIELDLKKNQSSANQNWFDDLILMHKELAFELKNLTPQISPF